MALNQNFDKSDVQLGFGNKACLTDKKKLSTLFSYNFVA